MSLPSVGVIGIGAFGSKVALRLLWNGWPALHIYDVADISTRQFTNDYGGQSMGSPRMTAQTCDIVVAVLPDAAALREVCFGWENLVKGFPNGGTIVNLGVADPREIAAIASELAAKGVDFVDAPAWGTRDQAKSGDLTLLVGARPEAFERVRPVLEKLATRIDHVGLPGAPQALGAIADFLRGAELAVACEAVRIGAGFGLDPAYVARLAGAPSGVGVATLLREEVLTRRFESGRALGMLRGNIERAAALAASLGLVSPMLEATQRAWREADAEIGSGADHTEIIRWLERLKPASKPPDAGEAVA